MRTDKSFSIDFIIRKDKKDKTEGYLFARVTVDGENTEISLKEKIKVADWDSKSETVKGRGREAKSINDWIDDVRFKLKESRKALEVGRFRVTCNCVKDHYEGKHISQKPPESGHTMKELFRFHEKIEGNVKGDDMVNKIGETDEEEIQGEQRAKLKGGTLKNYVTTEKYVDNFLQHKYKKKDIDLFEFDYQAALELESYIRKYPLKKHDPCLGNGVYKHMERVIKMFGMAADMHWIKFNPFDAYVVKKKKIVRQRLTVEYFVFIENSTFHIDRLNFVRDLFIFDCYLGVSYVDLMALSDYHFEEIEGYLFCTIYRQKSVELAGIPVPQMAKKIMEKYRNTSAAKERGKIFPYISNKDFNNSLKIIGGILNLPLELDTRKARAFFAREVNLKNGVPLETVSKMMGHTKISTTKNIYADVDEEKIIEDTAHVQDRFNRKKEKYLKVV
ncbi:site-specific integrase [Filimonas effusa]|uniref:Tyr recombinase domain-containing protein n=1 Tax=Filimonas effusa TaxID=2508721 RepID=A0A4Q1D0R2_9BACT|nr:site-specific integrase [Filimonas effusa]RXK81262.1 hypothetical protein ESB13_20210 [Filimonas effusa]